MRVQNGHRSGGVNGVGFQRGVSIVLCAMMAASPVYAANGAADGAGTVGAGTGTIPVERHTAALTEQEKVLHALNRFTFGPRPGDVAAVEAMGLDRWFEMQLHPGKIDDAAFEEEMSKFPAMRLSALELMRRFPSPQMIRQMGTKGVTLPGDPVERAIYRDAEAEYEAKLKKDAVGAVGGTAGGVGVAGVGGVAEGGAADVAMNCNAQGGGGGCARAGSMGAGQVESGQVEAVLGLGPEERMRRLVGMSPKEMMAFRAGLRPKDRGRLVEGLTPMEVESVEAMQGGPVRVVGAEAMESRLMRDVDSQRQLQAVMTEFWLNHFNVYLRKNQQEPYLLPEYERDVILPHALGRFEDLLVATAKSPAMLMYLDNWESVGPNSKAAGRVAQIQKMRPDGKMAQKLPKGINENYGRELMELHTLGVGGGYTQKDVVEVAKCFTGWTIDRPYGGIGGGAGMAMGMQGGRFAPRDDATPGEFVFEPNRHEPGSKVVLGQKIAEGGMNEGMEVLHLLARSPQTAHFLSQELAVRFVSDTPPATLVDRMAKTYLKSDGDIAAVLTTMFRAKEFWSPEVYRAKVKTPLEFMTSALRASDAKVTNALPLVQAMDRLGMPIYGMQTPNGYGWTAEDWVSSNALIARMNFALVLSGGRVAGTTVDWAGLLGAGGAGSGANAGMPSVGTENALEGALLGQAATDRTRSAVMAEFGNPTVQEQAAAGFEGGAGMVEVKAVRAGKAEAPLDTMAGLLLGSPEFQRR